MKLHGGRIGVESEGEGLGATFFIDIPIVRAQVIQHANPSARSKVALREMLRNMITAGGEEGSYSNNLSPTGGLFDPHLLPFPGLGRASRASSRRIVSEEGKCISFQFSLS